MEWLTEKKIFLFKFYNLKILGIIEEEEVTICHLPTYKQSVQIL